VQDKLQRRVYYTSDIATMLGVHYLTAYRKIKAGTWGTPIMVSPKRIAVLCEVFDNWLQQGVR
jgi:hypothetical protein